MAGKDGFDQLHDIVATVLIVGIGIDNDVGSTRKTFRDTDDEGGREAPILWNPHYVRPEFARDDGRSVAAPIVNDKNLD